MKKGITNGFFLTLLMLFFIKIAYAEGPMPAAPPSSKEFEMLKTLLGKWEGTQAAKDSKEQVQVDYHLSSGGTAIVETLFPGTPHEMISVYHDEHGKLVMTHYCMLGNQPKMAVNKMTTSELNFDFVHSPGVPKITDRHMHALNIAFNDKNTITESWSSYNKGKEEDKTIFKLNRLPTE